MYSACTQIMDGNGARPFVRAATHLLGLCDRGLDVDAGVVALVVGLVGGTSGRAAATLVAGGALDLEFFLV